MSIFDELGVMTGDSPAPDPQDDPEARGEEPAPEEGSGSGGLAELKRKLDEMEAANETLLARLATTEAALQAIGRGAPQNGGEPKPQKVTIEQLKEHAKHGPEAAFEAAVAFLSQEAEGFRDKFRAESREDASRVETRAEILQMLPGIDNPASPVSKAVLAEQRRIMARRPNLDAARAYDLALISVRGQMFPGKETTLTGEDPKEFSMRRRVETSGAAGAAKGGTGDPKAPGTVEFTQVDEANLRRLDPHAAVFSSDPKVRDAARKRFLKIKGNLNARMRSREED